jgi:hypothetical protein
VTRHCVDQECSPPTSDRGAVQRERIAISIPHREMKLARIFFLYGTTVQTNWIVYVESVHDCAAQDGRGALVQAEYLCR